MTIETPHKSRTFTKNDRYNELENTAVDLIYLLIKLNVVRHGIERFVELGDIKFAVTDHSLKYRARDIIHGMTHRITGQKAYHEEKTI